MEIIQFLPLLVFTTLVAAERRFSFNASNLGDASKVIVPISTSSDFANGMNRDWAEGYYSKDRSYFRAYMAVYDEVNYPNYKDIWQDKSGHIVISGKGVLWIGFGRPARQIAFALKYKKQGEKKGDTNKPLIRSFLVDTDTVIDISNRAVEERWRSKGLDINVDQSASPNQFGLDSVSTERLRQNALSGSMVTYYIDKPKRKPEAWGLVKDIKLLEHRVKKYNLDFKFPNKHGVFEVETLFPITQDVVVMNVAEAEAESAKYKALLNRRMVLLNLIDEVINFFDREGKAYQVMKTSFEKYVVGNKRILDTFRLGEDVTKTDVDAIETSLLTHLNNGKPSGKTVNLKLLERFRKSVAQVKAFSVYPGVEIKIGERHLIKEWNIFKDFQAFKVINIDGEIPLMPFAQDTTKIVIRMSYGDPEHIPNLCRFLKLNLIGERIEKLLLIPPLSTATESIIYGKRLADCIGVDHPTYQGKPLLPTMVDVLGQDAEEHRFYPDAQVVWTPAENGTMLLFDHGEVENLRIKGVLRGVRDILCFQKLKKDDVAKFNQINHMIDNHGSGVVIVRQEFIKWPKNKPIHS